MKEKLDQGKICNYIITINNNKMEEIKNRN